MHFLGEACYRRPLEPRSLTYSRGGTALAMGLMFLAFCGYLINLIYKDTPLIQLSSETMLSDIETPDIEVCAQNTTLTIVRCDVMNYAWDTSEIPNCFSDFFRVGKPEPYDVSRCYYFETKNRFRMTTGSMIAGPNATRRFDFYWRVDSMQNMSAATIAVPAITVQLYSPSFSFWNYGTIGDSTMEEKISTNIKLGISRSTSFLNFTSNIFYRPEKYRAIRPADAATILGFKSNFIEILTLGNYQHNWPLQSNPPSPPPALDKGLYHGVFSVQLSQSTIDVKTEVRQHTLLASIALAGGCYGVLTTIYILLFGMTRLTPWGLVHHIPVFISKHRRHDNNINESDSMFNNSQNEGLEGRADEESHTVKKKKNFYSNTLIPWFFRSRVKKSSESFNSADVKEAIMTKMIVRSKMQDPDQLKKLSRVDSTELHLLDTIRRPEPATSTSSCTNIDGLGVNEYSNKAYKKLSVATQQSSDSTELLYPAPIISNLPPALPPHNNAECSSRAEDNQTVTNDALQKEQIKSNILEARTTELSNRVEELEIILSEYFINTAYLDQLRVRRNAAIKPSDLPETLP